MIIYFVYLLVCFLCFVSIMLAAAVFQSEWKLEFKYESRRLWMILKTLTDGQATDDFERELSCCGFNNALDYCDRKSKSLENTGSGYGRQSKIGDRTLRPGQYFSIFKMPSRETIPSPGMVCRYIRAYIPTYTIECELIFT